MAVFVVAPLIVVVVYAFTNREWSVTLDHFATLGQYAGVFGRSFLLAFVATIVCILIGYPLAYFLAREQGRLRGMAMLLIMLPMWMNFLLRTYSWVFCWSATVSSTTCSPPSACQAGHHQHLRRGGAGHGVQFSSLYGAAHLLGHRED